MVDLGRGEELIFGGSAKHKSSQGYLTVTNKRIVFERVDGFLSKQKVIGLDLPFHAISGTSIEGSFKKKLIVTAKAGSIGAIQSRLDFEVDNPDSLKGKIDDLRLMDSSKESVESTVTEWFCPSCAHPNNNKLKQCEACGFEKTW